MRGPSAEAGSLTRRSGSSTLGTRTVPDLIESMPLRQVLSHGRRLQAALQILAVLLVALSCDPGHAAAFGSPDDHTHTLRLSESVAASATGIGARVAAPGLDCDGGAIVAASRREGGDAARLSAPPAPGPVSFGPPSARLAPRTHASALPSDRSLQLAGSLRI